MSLRRPHSIPTLFTFSSKKCSQRLKSPWQLHTFKNQCPQKNINFEFCTRAGSSLLVAVQKVSAAEQGPKSLMIHGFFCPPSSLTPRRDEFVRKIRERLLVMKVSMYLWLYYPPRVHASAAKLELFCFGILCVFLGRGTRFWRTNLNLSSRDCVKIT